MSLRRLAVVVVAVGIVVVIALVTALFLVEIPAVQGAAVGGLVGVIGSVVTGVSTLLLAYRLRRTGEIRHRSPNNWIGATYGAVQESRTFSIRLLNERDTGTALWDLQVVFYKDGRPWLSQVPRQTQADTPVDLLDLPPNETVTQVFKVTFNTGGDALRKARESDRIKLIANIPGEGTFEEDLPSWGTQDSPSKGRTEADVREEDAMNLLGAMNEHQAKDREGEVVSPVNVAEGVGLIPGSPRCDAAVNYLVSKEAIVRERSSRDIAGVTYGFYRMTHRGLDMLGNE